ncbi:MAG: TolC family protein [Bacteroidaceae bacterium]
MRKSRTYLLALLCGSLAVPSQAQKPMTLEDCIHYALANNITVKQREVGKLKSKIELSSSRNSRLPDFSANASQSFSFGRGLTGNNTYVNRSTQSTSLGFNTNVPLFTGFRIPNQIALARLDLEASIEDLKKAREDLALQVTQSYMEVLFQQELIGVAQSQLILSRLQAERIQKMLANGKAAEPDLAEARALVAQEKSTLTQAKGSFKLTLLALSQLLELASPDSLVLASPMLITPTVYHDTPEEIFSIAVTERPSIKANQIRLKGMERNIKIARSGYYPSLSFGAGIGTNYYKTSGYQGDAFHRQLSNNLNEHIALNLNIPIFNRFETRNAIRRARLNYEMQNLELTATKKSLYKEIQQAYYNTMIAEEQYNSSKFSEQAAQLSFEFVAKKYENGKASATEYAAAKAKQTKAISDRLQAQYSYVFKTKILDFYRGIKIEDRM